MQSKSFLVIAGIAIALTLALVTTLFAQNPQSVPYQGQNTKRFQMFFGPIARADTFLVDTATARVWQASEAKNGNLVFQATKVLGNPAKGAAGRYVLYFGTKARADTFLVDTEQGHIWQIFVDSNTGELLFKKITVEGVYKNG